MKTLWRVLPALALLAASAGLASAQGKDKKGPPLGFSGGVLQLLEIADVHKDLQLSDEQVTKVKGVLEKQTQAIKEILKESKGKDALEKVQELTMKNQRVVGEILTDKQRARVRQLELQQRGAIAFFDPQVTKGLGVSDEQNNKIHQILKDLGGKLKDLFRDKPKAEEIPKKMAALQKATLDDIVKSLTEGQQKKWRDMIGEPFKGNLTPGFGPPPPPAGGQVRELRPPLPVRRMMVLT